MPGSVRLVQLTSSGNSTLAGPAQLGSNLTVHGPVISASGLGCGLLALLSTLPVIEPVLLVARHEGEVADVFMEVREGKLERRREALEEGRVGVLLRFQVVNGDPLKVGDDEVARDLVAAPTVGEGADVFHALGVRFAEVFARAFVFGEQGTGPEEVNVGPITRELLHRLLVAGDAAAFYAEDVEEVIPKGLAFGGLTGLVFPLVGKGDGAVLDFIPRERPRGIAWHGGGRKSKADLEADSADTSVSGQVHSDAPPGPALGTARGSRADAGSLRGAFRHFLQVLPSCRGRSESGVASVHLGVAGPRLRVGSLWQLLAPAPPESKLIVKRLPPRRPARTC